MSWPADVTRRHGLGEFSAVWRGWLKAQGVNPDARPMTKADLAALEERVANG